MATSYIWPRSVNFFFTPIQNSYVGANTIINFTDLRLFLGKADPAILNLYNDYHPLVVTFNAKYSVWSSLRSSNPGNTLGVVQELDLLSSTYIKDWDILVQGFYKNTSPRYKVLLPHKRSPFQTGTIENRVLALNNLVIAIGADANLAALKVTVSTFIADLNLAISKQSGQVGTIDTAITDLDAAAFAAAEGLFLVYGGLITKFYKTPIIIDTFYKVDMLHKVVQTMYTAILKTLKPKKLSSRKLNALLQLLKCTNLGEAIVRIYFTNGLIKVPLAGMLYIDLLPNVVTDVPLAAAGYTAINHCLFIANMGTGTQTVTVQIVG